MAVLSIGAAACSTTAAHQGSPTTRAAAGASGSGAPVPSSGCSGPAAVSVDRIASEHHRRRHGSLVSADDAGRAQGVARPVVIDLHGLSEGATLEAITSQFSRQGDAGRLHRGVSPRHGNPVGWDIHPSTAGHPNRRHRLHERHPGQPRETACVDTSRDLCHRPVRRCALHVAAGLHHDRSRFAAFAPVAGIVVPIPCRPGQPVAILGLSTARPTHVALQRRHAGDGAVTAGRSPGPGYPPTSRPGR